MQIDTHIDARGLLCPLPVLRLRKVLETLPAGAVVELLSTDGASWIDVPHFCRNAGHLLLSASETGGVRCYLIRRG